MSTVDGAMHTANGAANGDDGTSDIEVDYRIRVRIKDGRLSAQVDGIQACDDGLRRCVQVLALVMEDLLERAEREQIEQADYLRRTARSR